MAKATKTIRQTFANKPEHAAWFEQTQVLFNRIVAFYFDCIQAGEHLAVCTVQTVEGTILATYFIGGGKEISGFRKRQLGRIARNRRKTGIMAEGEQDNAALWRKIRAVDEQVAHLVSARIIQFAKEHKASIVVFEHLGNLKPEKGKYSRRGNSKQLLLFCGIRILLNGLLSLSASFLA